MPYVVTRVGSSLKVVESGSGDVMLFSSPTVSLYNTTVYLTRPLACVEILQGTRSVQLTVANTTSINGATGAAIDSLTKISDALAAIPSGNITAQTAAGGTTYTLFASTTCTQLTVFNGAGTSIDVQQNATGAAVAIPSGMAFTFVGITNANQLGVKRTDNSTTQVTVGARYQA